MKAIVLVFLLIFTQMACGISYTVVDPWEDRVWLNGWYTAVACLAQKENLTPYIPLKQPDLQNGSIVLAVGDLINYISYGEEGVNYFKPYVYSYSCNCVTDEEGRSSCSTCYSCKTTKEFVTISNLGFSAGAWELEQYNEALNRIAFKNWSEKELIGDSNSVKAQLNHAYNAYQEARALYVACKMSASYEPTNYVASTYGDRRVERLISYESYLALVDPSMPSLPGYPCSVQRPSANGTACKNFPVKWIEAVRGATTALTKSLEAGEKNIALLRQQYQQMSNAGLCDDDYNEKPKSVCIRAREALLIIESGTKEATYGQFVVALEKKTELQKKVYCFPPQLDDYNTAMEYLWKDDGFNPKVTRLKDDSIAAFSDANKICSDYITKASEYKQKTDEKKVALANEQLELIKEAQIQTTLGEAKVGMIAERWQGWKTKKDNADGHISYAIETFTKRKQGYLKEATMAAKEAIKNYGGLESEGDDIKASAQKVVEEKSKIAQGLLQQLESFYQRSKNQKIYSYYQQAKQKVAAAESAKTLGEKYKQYANAIDYARIGLNNGIIEENETSTLVAQVDDLIKRAEVDEVNVETEKILFRNMKTSGQYDPPALREIIESIIVKAWIKYGDLIERKNMLSDYINASKECGQDLIGDLQNADKGFVTKNGVDYINALGQLKKISKEYDMIEEELKMCQEKIILNGLYVESKSSFGTINIDQPSQFSVFIIVMNLKPTNATSINVPIKIETNTSIFLSDITTGRENVAMVRNDGNNLILTIKEIKPLKTFSIKIEKNAVLAKTITVSSNATGKSDRSADISEKRIVDVYANGKLNLPSDAIIDGKYAIFIEPGRHVIERTYNIKNAYTKNEQTETDKLGTNLQIRKTIQIKPIIYLDQLQLDTSFDYKNITNIQITSNDAKIENKKCTLNACSFDAKNLKANKTSVIYIEYVVLNAKEELQTISVQIPSVDGCFGSEKKCGKLPQDLNQMIASLNSAVEANDTARAVEIKERLKEKIDDWKVEQQNIYNENNDLKTKIKQEGEDIDEALKNIKRNTTLVNELGKRMQIIKTALKEAEGATNIEQENAALKKAEGNDVKKIIEDCLIKNKQNYDELRKRLFDIGETSTPLPFITIEQKIGELEISGDPKIAVELEEALEEGIKYVNERERKAQEELHEIEILYKKTNQNLTTILAQYNEEKGKARGTEWESFFVLDVEKIEKIKSEAETALDNNEYRFAKVKVEQLQRQKEIVEKAMWQLKREAESSLANVVSNYLNKKESMDTNLQKTIDEALRKVEEMISKGAYINALKSLKDIFKQITEYKPETINLALVVGALLLVAAAIAAYYMKKKGIESGPGENIKIELPILTKKKKEYKKLEKVNGQIFK